MPGTGQIPQVPGLFDGSQGFNQFIQAMTGLFGDNTNTTTTTDSPIASNAVTTLLQFLMPQMGSQDFSREAALRDSKGEVSDIIQQMMDNGIPLISSQEAASGGYNSTTAKLMANDLAGRSAREGALAGERKIVQYQGFQNNRIQQIIAAIVAATNAQKVVDSRTNKEGLVENENARRAAAAAAAAAALRALTSKKPGAAPNRADKNRNPAAARRADSGAAIDSSRGTGGDEGSPDTGTGGDFPRGSDADAADRDAEDALYPRDFTDINAEDDEFGIREDFGGLDDGTSMGMNFDSFFDDPSDFDFMDFSDFGIDLGSSDDLGSDLMDGSDFLFFGDDGTGDTGSGGDGGFDEDAEEFFFDP